MFRSNFPRIALLWTLLIAPWNGGAVEPDESGNSPLPPIAGEGSPQGDVSVDLNESTPGLTPEVYRATLGSHGDWYASPRYGEVWRPRVAAGWRPYYNGVWLWTDEGWYWDSDEPFAWAVYHYGRWVYDPSWGWVWIPGYQWAPAWVAWRFGSDTVGWAPLGPGVSVFVTAYPFVDIWWTFVPTTRFVGVPVYQVAYPRRETPRYFRETAPAPPRTAPRRDGRVITTAAPAWGGPSRRTIEERMGRPIEATRRPSGLGIGGREERARSSPGWTAPSRGAERERQSTFPAPRREELGRPAARPAPRDGDRAPSMAPAPRPEPERRREAPGSRGAGEPRRQRSGWER
jgi:hypothetical protein